MLAHAGCKYKKNLKLGGNCPSEIKTMKQVQTETMFRTEDDFSDLVRDYGILIYIQV